MKLHNLMAVAASSVVLSACNDHHGFNEDFKSAVGRELSGLSSALKWNGLAQCGSTNSAISVAAQAARRNIHLHRQRIGISVQTTNFVDRDILPSLQSLSEESAFLAQRCAAADYDNTGFSPEREIRLQQFVQEWRSAIDFFSQGIEEDYSYNLDGKSGRQAKKLPVVMPTKSFTDCDEAVCERMVVIPTGQFVMGGSAEEHKEFDITPQTVAWETPQHPVQVTQAFALGAHEVSLGNFLTFMQETGYRIPDGCTQLKGDPLSLVFESRANLKNVGFPQNNDQPVTCVRRQDAEAYTQWLSRKTGETYRLPTEAEWDYAARAGTQTAYFWGSKADSQACKFANVYDLESDEVNQFGFAHFPCTDGYAYLAPVGSFQPNDFELFDMIGNAREWVADCWHGNFVGAPANQREWGSEEGGLCHFAVLKGGAWPYNTFNDRIAYRDTYYSSQFRAYMYGFRVARDIHP
ncbi:formylglycine-generating enzyme family protein [Pseudomonas chlororaphis]|uniref:Sulfatase-modifying factor enzyme-like domain-containing protein n=1 Tax=Pseudomonas chlororaphis TaxID=587753 RepID=A0A1Q8EM69_9PSED|nr:formylglycine-generating enzyme family protein [Pseudomonas chlororaphis]OLF52901.1 hypothetical protein BTN82_19185 [Pseudomonas chlororaphis]